MLDALHPMGCRQEFLFVSWWEVLTDQGRSVSAVIVRWDWEELHVQVYCLKPGEVPLVLIDHLKNQAHFLGDPDQCHLALAAHGYEGVREPMRAVTDWLRYHPDAMVETT
jgi:hypothetical protein